MDTFIDFWNIPLHQESLEEDAHFGTGSYFNYKYQEQELQETGFYPVKWRNYMPE